MKQYQNRCLKAYLPLLPRVPFSGPSRVSFHFKVAAVITCQTALPAMPLAGPCQLPGYHRTSPEDLRTLPRQEGQTRTEVTRPPSTSQASSEHLTSIHFPRSLFGQKFSMSACNGWIAPSGFPQAPPIPLMLPTRSITSSTQENVHTPGMAECTCNPGLGKGEAGSVSANQGLRLAMLQRPPPHP